jgi:hypothetical protein
MGIDLHKIEGGSSERKCLRIYFDATFHDGTYKEYCYEEMSVRKNITLWHAVWLLEKAVENTKTLRVADRTFDYKDCNILLLDSVRSMKLRKVTVHNDHGEMVGKLNEWNEWLDVDPPVKGKVNVNKSKESENA